jgi:hypothetical protein
VVGVPGQRGHIPKRSDQRRRRNKDGIETVKAAGATTVAIPEPDESWHPAAARWYRSLAESGQSQYFEPSDWAQAAIWAEFLSRALNQGARPSSQLVASWAAGASELLSTEGARRRVRVELERGQVDPDVDSAVTALAGYRSRFTNPQKDGA